MPEKSKIFRRLSKSLILIARTQSVRRLFCPSNKFSSIFPLSCPCCLNKLFINIILKIVFLKFNSLENSFNHYYFYLISICEKSLKISFSSISASVTGITYSLPFSFTRNSTEKMVKKLNDFSFPVLMISTAGKNNLFSILNGFNTFLDI